jgi:hypothetical protein
MPGKMRRSRSNAHILPKVHVLYNPNINLYFKNIKVRTRKTRGKRGKK